MTIHYQRLFAVAFALVACTSLPTAGLAQSKDAIPADQAHSKSVWDISTALLPGDLNYTLQAVRTTHDLIASKGAQPDIVLLFRSMSPTQVAQTEMRGRMVAPALVEESRKSLQELAALPGVRLQADANSKALVREEYRELVTLVDDVFLALINYQAQGYSLVTIYPLAGLR